MSLRRRAVLNLSGDGYGIVRIIGDSDAVTVGRKVYSGEKFSALLRGLDPDGEIGL
jgi:hypothetical protein